MKILQDIERLVTTLELIAQGLRDLYIILFLIWITMLVRIIFGNRRD